MSYIRIQGSSLVSTLGDSVSACANTVLQGGSTLVNVPLESFAEPWQVPYFAIRKTTDHSAERFYSLFDKVVEDAFIEAGLTPEQRQKTALFLGSSSFDVFISETQYTEQLANEQKALPLPITCFAHLLCRLRQKFGLLGDDYTFSTACSASANAMMSAATMLKQGWYDHALVIGVELFNTTTVSGFSGLQLLSAKKAMKPFDENRDGLLLGEGCSAVVLSACDNIEQPGFYFVGGASNCDTHSVTAANPDGSSIASVIKKALANSAINASEISVIKTHGTATVMNDEAESAGLKSVFDSKILDVIALKPYLGHTLGACGINELTLLMGLLNARVLPKARYPSDLNENLGMIVNQQEKPVTKGAYYLLNYFGFGGNNTALVIQHVI